MSAREWSAWALVTVLSLFDLALWRIARDERAHPSNLPEWDVEDDR